MGSPAATEALLSLWRSISKGPRVEQFVRDLARLGRGVRNVDPELLEEIVHEASPEAREAVLLVLAERQEKARDEAAEAEAAAFRLGELVGRWTLIVGAMAFKKGKT